MRELKMKSYLLPILLLAACGADTTDPVEPAPAEPADIVVAEPAEETEVSPFAGVYGYEGEIEGEGFTGADAVGMAFIGRWVSEDDPLAMLDIDFGDEDLSARFGYDGELDEAEPMLFVTDCETRSREMAGADSGYFTIGEGDDALCYAVDSMTNERLVVAYLPRGVITTYVLDSDA